MIEILERLAADAAPVLVDFVLASLLWLIAQGAMFLRRRTHSDLAQYGAGALERLDGVVRDAVGATVLKEQATLALADGRLTKEEVMALVETARNEARGLLGKRGLDALAKVLDRDSLELIIATKVKAAIEQRFASGPTLLEALDPEESR